MRPETECRRAFAALVKKWIADGTTVTAMESCPGGYIASLITDNEGASSVFGGSVVTYGNEAKIRAGVDPEVIGKYGVYSVQTAEAMAETCRKAFGTDIGIGVTGSLGRPDPANPGSKVGTVYIAVSCKSKTASRVYSDIAGETRRESKAMIACRIAELLKEF